MCITEDPCSTKDSKVVEWTMRKLGVEEWLVRAVMAMYKHVRARVRSYDGSVSE